MALQRKDWSQVPVPQSYDDLYRNYGNPNDLTFEQDYIVAYPHQLASGRTIHVYSHIAIVGKLHDIWLNNREYIHTYDGCYNYRAVRGGSNLSIHSWGLAIDLNASEFPLGSHARQDEALTEHFKSLGFFYGGDYQHRKDPMHYQYAGDF